MVITARLARSTWSSISCYTKQTGRDVELCHLVFLSVDGFFENITVRVSALFAYNSTKPTSHSEYYSIIWIASDYQFSRILFRVFVILTRPGYAPESCHRPWLFGRPAIVHAASLPSSRHCCGPKEGQYQSRRWSYQNDSEDNCHEVTASYP